MKRSEAQSVRQIIDAVLRRDDIRGAALAHRAAWLWGEIVGPEVNRRTGRRYVAGGVLHVHIEGSALKQELSFMRQAIVAHINRALGEEVVSDIHIH